MKFILFVVLLGASLMTSAEEFLWRDEAGKVHIGLQPQPKLMDVKKNTNSSIKQPTASHSKQLVTKPVKKPTKPRMAKPRIVTKRQSVNVPIVMPIRTKSNKTPVRAKILTSAQPSSKLLTSSKKTVNQIKTKQKAPVTKKKLTIRKVITSPIVMKKSAPTLKNSAVTKSDDSHNSEMCGIFKGYVLDYKNKLLNCSGAVCAVYKKSLLRYEKKKKSYCR